ncbi:response regulator [Anaerocellum diazotrophicum]|uniref:AraC family transcriptional regulator n=1 Tax=Caldicellulosiruptor diazotrophicus TaxID=2806205 RepID=A0ABN6E965_9FIRM|nr:response regulator [Caldicellulosiruptor diazotrophicus]BCS82090.1 AraC family transcriptional regulator [Caldicellulosiruptor diazotrophicus]
MKILIVDDEMFSRENIKEIISSYGGNKFEIIETESSEEALEFCKSFFPQIIFIDIRMPHMDGIELAVRIRQILPSAAIIFVSAYPEKEYLKAALSLRAIRFVEKPIIATELIEAFEEALSQVKEKEEHILSLFSGNRDTLDWIKLAIGTLLSEGGQNSSEIYSLEKIMGADVLRNITAVSIAIKFLKNDVASLSSYLLTLVNSFLNTIQRKKCYENICAFYTLKDHLVFIYLISPKKEIRTSVLISFCNELKDFLETYNLKFLIGVGKIVYDIREINSSSTAALLALEDAYIKKAGYVAFFEERKYVPFPYGEKERIYFFNLLNQKNYEQAKIFVKSLALEIRKRENLRTRDIKLFFFKLIEILDEREAERKLEIYLRILDTTILDELVDIIIEEIDRYRVSALQKYENEYVNKMIEFLNENYSKPELRIEDVSRAVNLSTSYACFLFKKVTGKTIKQYLLELRARKAEELLRGGSEKIKDVSNKVGFRYSDYFTKKFKKITGILPSHIKNKKKR